MKFFYARTSDRGQNLARQLECARQFSNIDRYFCDQESGKDFDRPQYQEMKATLQPGDEVIVKELDRLGRNKDLVKKELEWFKQNDITLRILDIPTTLIDFGDQVWINDMVTNILVEVMASIAEQERVKIRNRQREGIDAMPIVNGRHVSTKTGSTYGRKPNELPDLQKFVQKQKAGELSVKECCEALGISRRTWYNRVGEQ